MLYIGPALIMFSTCTVAVVVVIKKSFHLFHAVMAMALLRAAIDVNKKGKKL